MWRGNATNNMSPSRSALVAPSPPARANAFLSTSPGLSDQQLEVSSIFCCVSMIIHATHGFTP